MVAICHMLLLGPGNVGRITFYLYFIIFVVVIYHAELFVICIFSFCWAGLVKWEETDKLTDDAVLYIIYAIYI